MKKKLLIICGPTATGKTKLAIRLAKLLNGEIISADSRQIYQGMDIGTGKDREIFKKNQVAVWGLDLVKPDEILSAVDFCRLARLVIKKIWQKEKLPIIVGGTGFYLKVLIEGIETSGVKPDWQKRAYWETRPVQELYDHLASLDSQRAAGLNDSDRANPRRLIRAIEVAGAEPGQQARISPLKIDHLFWIGLKTDLKKLYFRIDQRVKKRVKQGIKSEIKKLLNQSYRWSTSALGRTLGYQEWQPFFAGQASQTEVVKRWQDDEHAYARRQMTWFKKALRETQRKPVREAQGKSFLPQDEPPREASEKENQVVWADIDQPGWQKKVENLVRQWLAE